MKIIECKTDTEIALTLPLMQQLYKDVEFSAYNYVETIRAMYAKSYRMIATLKDGEYLGAAVFFYLTTFDAGELPYVQELIVDEHHRSQGIGTLLLAYIGSEARIHGCKYISLNAEKMDEAAQKYYHKLGYEVDAYYLIKQL